MEWERIALEISKAITLDTRVSKRTLMIKLLSSLDELLYRYINTTNTIRIWTLHKVSGSQVVFYDSDDRAEPATRNKYKKTNEGLIGKTIISEREYQIYNNTPEIDGFVEGWDKCKSELIVLVRNRFDNIIAIINIESDNEKDFIVDDNDEQSKFEEELLTLLRLFANHIAVVFELEENIILSTNASSIIRAISRDGIDTRQTLDKSLSEISRWNSMKYGLVRSLYLLTDVNKKNNYQNSSIKHVYSNTTYPDFNSEHLENMAIDEKVLRYDGFPSRCTDSDLKRVFGSPILHFSNIEGYETISYLQIFKITTDYHNNTDKNLILLSVYDNRNNVKNTDLENIFRILNRQILFLLNYQEMKYQNIISKSISVLNSSFFKNDYMSSLLNELAAHVATNTNSELCMIYLTVHEKRTNEEMKFFIGGQGGHRTIKNIEKRFPAETIIGKMIKNDKNYYFCPDYFDCEDRSDLLDEELKTLGFNNPVLHAHLLFAKKHKPIGAIVLISETTQYIDSSNFVAKSQIEKYISDLSFHIGNVIQSKTLFYIDEILSNTYKSFLDLSVNDDLPDTSELDKFQYRINAVIKKSLQPISDKIYFSIYKRKGKEFISLSSISFQEDVSLPPPVFKLNKGLTGSVMFQPSGEIFVPYVEDIKIENDADFLPEIKCRTYWDYLIGDSQRFYYGKHIRVNTNQDYILLIIGHRTEAFYPSIAYKILSDIVQNIGDHLKVLLKDTFEEDDIVIADEIFAFTEYLVSKGQLKKSEVEEIFAILDKIKSESPDIGNESAFEQLVKKLKQLSEYAKEGKNATDNVIGAKENIEKLIDWLDFFLQ